MRFITLITICAIVMVGRANDIIVCTEDSKILIDDILLVVESFVKDPLNPSADSIKQLLAGLQKLLVECAHVQVDLTRFDKCVDEILPLIPLVKKLIEDISEHKQSEIIIDVTRLALELTQSITVCMKKDIQIVSF